MESEGKIQIYTGDGKGKTTASIGSARVPSAPDFMFFTHSS